MKEIWRDIVGYEKMYQISNLGRVKSLARAYVGRDGRTWNIKEKILKPCFNNYGYYHVGLTKNSKLKLCPIHTLVVKAFIDQNYRDKNLVVNHIDGVRSNNNLDNLEIVTSRSNNSSEKCINKKSSSKYTGVSWHKGNKKWKSGITIQKKYYCLGYSTSEVVASEKYQKALQIYEKQGLQALLNYKKEISVYNKK